jgi:hypothetical protein
MFFSCGRGCTGKEGHKSDFQSRFFSDVATKEKKLIQEI